MSTIAKPGHLFLSYSRVNREIVTEIARRLEVRGVTVFMDVFEKEMHGRRFLEVIENGIRKAGAVAVFVGPAGLGAFERLEVNLAVIQSVQRGMPVVPVLLPGAGDSELALFLECFSWIDLRGGLDDTHIEKLAQIGLAFKARAEETRERDRDNALSDLILRTKRHLIISGHTLDRFTRQLDVKQALLSVIQTGAKITILQLNPESSYATAHRPFHDLESTSSAHEQHTQALEFFLGIFRDMARWQQQNIDVSFTSYMPRHRAVIVDDAVYAYLYMYNMDVADEPDIALEPTDSVNELLRRRILYSTMKLIYAPETIPLIRSGQTFPEWRRKYLSGWSNWTADQRRRHRLTHEFYVTHAKVFHDRFGQMLERYVHSHLDHTKGRTLVLGCGSGKEVEYLARRRPHDYVCGVDFSHVAIDLARQKRGNPNCFMLGDFYDLDHLESLRGESFDSVVGNASFVHLIEREDIDELLRKVNRRLKDTGVLFLRCLFKEHDGRPLTEEIDTSLSHLDGWGAGRWFVYFSRRELADRCRKAGFTVDDRATEVIARSVHHARGASVRTVLEKGFPHSEYADVYWSCVLARKSSGVTD